MSESIANRYRIDGPLGVDATAFQAFDLQLSRPVVIKTLPASRVGDGALARQFHQEATAAARLTHQNVVRVYDVCEAGANCPEKAGGRDPFMVLEWIPGRDLRAFLASRDPLPAEEASDPFERKIDLLVQLCRGLHHGHALGLTHRSVNPENIRVTPAGEAKLLNFGITPLGTITSRNYLAPEQVRGETKPDPRTDVFSLGVILYELLFGAHPFSAGTEEQIISKIQAGEYRPVDELLPGVPRDLAELVKQSLAPDPEARIPDCRALQSGLQSLRRRLGEEKNQCRARLVSFRAALQKDARSQQGRLFDLAVLESADPNCEDYERLLRSCSELAAVSERAKRQAQLEKVVESAGAEADAGHFETALALLADVLRGDPTNARARSLELAVRRRNQVAGLLAEAREKESAGDLALGCILALQAVQVDPDAWDAKSEFERMQALLRQRRQPDPPGIRSAEVRPPASGTRRGLNAAAAMLGHVWRTLLLPFLARMKNGTAGRARLSLLSPPQFVDPGLKEHKDPRER